MTHVSPPPAWRRAALVLLLAATSAGAGPTLIRDSRVEDLSTTPLLGRGYSISTNSFQSACLKDVIITEPSYDFQYVFKELESSTASSSSMTVSANAAYSGFFIDAAVSQSVARATQSGRTAHNILVTLNMDTYYASVNEAGTPLSPAASALLGNQDVPGFFGACGPYYTRGITRNAQFVSVFTYETTSTKRDTQFESALQLQLKGFSGGGSATAQGAFSTEAASRNLTITSRGWGLGKNEDAALISYDLDTFKAAIKQAFLSMQNPLTGRVTSIEVVPWVENAEFQATLNMRGQDIVLGKEVPLYEKKDILVFNGEFLTEAERAARVRLNLYYKAKVCKDAIVANYYEAGTLPAAVQKRQLKNHRLLKPGITLGELDSLLKDSEIEKLWRSYEDFLYMGKANMEACVTSLLREPNPVAVASASSSDSSGGAAQASGTGRGIFLQRFTSVKSCVDLQKIFPVQLPEKIEDNCMPEPL
jgi:hypothetical protein